MCAGPRPSLPQGLANAVFRATGSYCRRTAEDDRQPRHCSIDNHPEESVMQNRRHTNCEGVVRSAKRSHQRQRLALAVASAAMALAGHDLNAASDTWVG